MLAENVCVSTRVSLTKRMYNLLYAFNNAFIQLGRKTKVFEFRQNLTADRIKKSAIGRGMQMRKKGQAQFYFLVERVVRLGRVSFVSVFSGLILVDASLELKSDTSRSVLDDATVLDLKNLFSTLAEAVGCWRSRSASTLDLLEAAVLR